VPGRRFTDHRTIAPTPADQWPRPQEVPGIHVNGVEVTAEELIPAAVGIGLGDKVVLVFSDDHKRISARLSDGTNDLEKGRLSVGSPLGKAILGAEEGDEVELTLENGRQRKVLIESVDRDPIPIHAARAPQYSSATSAAAVIAQ